MKKAEIDLEKIIIDIIKKATNKRLINKEAIIQNIGVDSIEFAKILILIEEKTRAEFLYEMPLLSECVTINDLICRVRNTIGTRKGNEEK